MRQHPEKWEDMSNYLVHFTKGSNGVSGYDAMMSIYANCVLWPGRQFGIGKSRAPAGTQQEAVCFSGIPAGQWQRLEERRGTKYGLAFSKEYILSLGGGPVWYAWKDTPHWQTLQDMMAAADGDADAPIWKFTAMIDAPGVYGNSEYFFEWEREWRHIGAMSFTPEDVAFLLIPEALHTAAQSFFEDAYRENIGPAYFCPYIDPSWSKEKIINELKK